MQLFQLGSTCQSELGSHEGVCARGRSYRTAPKGTGGCSRNGHRPKRQGEAGTDCGGKGYRPRREEEESELSDSGKLF